MSEAEPGRAGDVETKGTAILIGLTIQDIVHIYHDAWEIIFR